MSRCVEAAAVAATVPGAGVGSAGLRPPMVPRQASFFPPSVPNPFVQQTRMSAAKRTQVRGVGVRGEGHAGEGRGYERGDGSRGDGAMDVTGEVVCRGRECGKQSL